MKLVVRLAESCVVLLHEVPANLIGRERVAGLVGVCLLCGAGGSVLLVVTVRGHDCLVFWRDDGG